MEAAIANEAYERAAELRDAIRAQMAKKTVAPSPRPGRE